MTETEFKNLLAAYGANPVRWPEDRRAAGELYLETNPDAPALLQAEAELDAALDRLTTPTPSDILEARILKAATGQVSLPLQTKPARLQYWKMAASFAAMLAIGVVGYSAYTLADPQSEETVWLEAANELGVSDIYAWVEGTE